MLSLRDLLNHQQLSQPVAPLSSSLFPGDDHTKKKKAVDMPSEIQYMKIPELAHSKLEIALKNVKLGQSRDKSVGKEMPISRIVIAVPVATVVLLD
jgi:hypothetical protein